MSETTIPSGTPFQVIGDHDGLDTKEYKCLANGDTIVVVPFADAFSNNKVTINIPDGFPKGSYTIDIIPVSPDDIEGDSDPNNICTLTVTGKKPKSVTNVLVVVP